MEGHNLADVSYNEMFRKASKLYNIIYSEKGNTGEDRYSSCQMYDVNFDQINDWDYKSWNYSEIPKTGEFLNKFSIASDDSKLSKYSIMIGIIFSN